MIIGFNFTKLDVERKNKLIKGMKVKYNMDISSVKELDVPLSTNQKGIDLDFEFTVDYNPDIAKILIRGTVSYMADEKFIGDVLKSWKKDKKLSRKISLPVINLILDRCNVKAMELEQELTLPTHLPMPSVKVSGPKKDDKGAEQYIG
jgi:hypothetical protein